MNAYLYPTIPELEAQLRQYNTLQAADGVARRTFGITGATGPTGPTGLTSRFTQPFEDEFIWRTHSGEEYYPSEMATMHLFYAVRMLFNNTVAPCFRVGKFKRYRDIADWSSEYKQAAATALVQELATRDDTYLEVTDAVDGATIADQISDMYRNSEVMDACGLDNCL